MTPADAATAAGPISPGLRCSFAAELRGDPLAGTAAPASGLVLVEQPGPWGRLALTQSRLDPAVGLAVGARAARHGLRALAIRRPGRAAERFPSRRRWAVVDCTPGAEDIRWGEFARDSDLLEIPLEGGDALRSDEPCFLVCTHGRHDACCAIRGRPVALALERLRPGAVWECSHVGGDRFAANVLALPHGLYYGRVTDTTAADLVAAAERTEVLPELLRGRTTSTAPVQAAQHHARAITGDLKISSFPLVSAEPTDGGWRVRLRQEPADLVITLRSTSAGPAALLTCGATRAAHPPTFVVDFVTTAD